MRHLKACRLCTKSSINRNLKMLFSDNHKLITQIKEITGILLKDVNSLPQHICKVCQNDLNKAYEFRVRCITSQEYFNSVDSTAMKDLPSKDFETEKEMPIIDVFNNDTDFCSVKNFFTPENETKNELIADKNLTDFCFLKTISKDAEKGPLYIGNRNSINNSANIHNDELSLNLSSNVKADTTKLNATLVPQEKRRKKTETIQQNRRKKSEKAIFVCDQCGMSFAYRSHFLAHQRRHTGEKVFHCEICPESFFENWQLQAHLRKHKGEKPFACELCGLRFLQNNARKLHVRRRHTNERPYVCSQCSKSFAVSGMLRRHMLTHTGEKSFRVACIHSSIAICFILINHLEKPLKCIMLNLKACRLCTKSTKHKNYKNIFGKNQKLLKQIEEITGILLKNELSLPQYICKVCLKDLEKAHDFRVRCIASQEYFSSVDSTAAKDLPSGDIEIKNEIPIIDEFNNDAGFSTPENIFIPEIEIKDELPIEEIIVGECGLLKTESKNIFEEEDRLFDIDNSNSSSCNHKDDISLNASDHVKTATNTLVLQETNLKKTEIKQKKRKKKPEKAGYVCDECGKSFGYISHFSAHQRRHAGDKVFHCEICPEKFYEKSRLKIHLRKHTGEKRFACEFCGLRFLKNDSKTIHVRRRHTNERPYACTQCPKAFAVSSGLTEHMVTHTGEKTFRIMMLQLKTCRLCAKSTVKRNYKNLFGKNHKFVMQIEEITGILLKNEMPLPKFICRVCLKDLENAYDFRVRCITSQEYFSSVDFTGEKDFPSDDIEIKSEIPTIDEFNNDPNFSTAGNVFSPENELNDKLNDDKNLADSCFLKTKSKEDVCQAKDDLSNIDASTSSSCNQSNHSADALSLNTSTYVKTNTTKLNAVLVPQEKNLKQADIQQKKRKKSEKVIFVCDQCGMSFPYRSNFLTHQRRHTGEKLFHCEICPEKFFEKFQLKVHLRRHKGEKPFACEFCGLCFLKKTAKNLHVRRRHTNERPYVCTHCPKAFAVSSMLTEHMLTHTGEKTFRCDVCDMWFGRKTNLVKHYRSLSHKQSEKKSTEEVE